MSNNRPKRPPLGLDPNSSTAAARNVGGVDQAIRASTAVAVIAVAGIAAYVSYWHAYEVVRAHGEIGVTARLEPATIDGLVYASSMVVLYAARHQLPVPRLARWLLGLGIVATLAANIAHGLSHGPVGAAVAAWPAASLVGSYELLLWLIRTAGGAERESTADLVDELRRRGCGLLTMDLGDSSCRQNPVLASINGSRDGVAVAVPGRQRTDLADAGECVGATTSSPQERADVRLSGDNLAGVWPVHAGDPESLAQRSVEKAAAAAYRVSVDQGQPLSERRLAAKFGRTSRRWARHRMAEARSLDTEPVLTNSH